MAGGVWRVRPEPALGVLLTALAYGGAPSPPPDPLAAAGLAVTGGAAPGYVPDEACGDCHGSLAASYEQVGMARSFGRPRREERLEDFGQPPFEHAPSRRRYQLAWRGERLIFRRSQLAPDGQPINVLELPVEWVLGSGQHARTYLYRTPNGELFQLPIAWYPQEHRFAMAPGYDRRDHDGVLRRVRRECLFCHNAYPDVPVGSDAHEAPHTFPAELPEGTGCQRCHGPGAEHVRAAMSADPVMETVRAAIVNPGRLPAARRDDVCFECHMQPAVELPGVRRFGRGDYSFRPGQALSDYLVQVDVDEADRSRPQRFEINHHPYRLRQSACYLKSQGRLSCLTCHDPHRKPGERERAAHYRKACLGCHEPDACRRPAGDPSPVVHADDCVSCHMPKRRTQDVVHVVMTDHLIRRVPGGPELLAPLQEREPMLVGVTLADAEQAPRGEEGELYRALAVARTGQSPEAERRLETLLSSNPPAQEEPWFDLARAQLRRQRYDAARETLQRLLARGPGSPVVRSLLAVALGSQGRHREALELLARLPSDDPGGHYNRGVFLRAGHEWSEAEAAFQAALRLRSNFAPAFYQLGLTQRAAGQAARAEASLTRALELDPTHTQAYLELAELLAARGQSQTARRFLSQGALSAARPSALRAALERLPAHAP